MEIEPKPEKQENEPQFIDKVNDESEYLGDVSFKFLTIRNILMTLPKEVFEIEVVQDMYRYSTELRDMFNNIGREDIRSRFNSSNPDSEKK